LIFFLKKKEREMIFVNWVNNHGGGLAERLKVENGTTVKEFLDAQLQGDPEDFVIRLNRRDCVAHDQVLEDGDDLYASPRKIGGSQ